MDKNIVSRVYLGGLLILALSLFYYQALKGEHYLRRAKNNYVRVVPLRSIRGSIFDRNSRVLAYDKAVFNIAVIPHQIEKKKNSLLKELAKFSDYDVNLIHRNYNKGLNNIFSPVDVILDINKSMALKLKERFKDDILINPQAQRHYSYPYEFAHLLGYVKEAAPFYESLKKYGYRPLERVGFLGIEQYHDAYLKGEDGGDLIEVNAAGRTVGFLGVRKPKRGKDVYLTIDCRIQKIAHQILGEKKGVIILMDSKSGEIFSLVSSPSFDPNFFIKGRNVQRFLDNKNYPLFNRAIQATYPLGSTFKPITGVAALEEGKITPSTKFNCIGGINIADTEFSCWSVHGEENLHQGLAHSCNVYFYNLGIILGAETMAKWAKKFGLDSLRGIDLPYEKKGFVPTPQWKTDALGKHWFLGDTLNLSIGQGFIEASPLEVLLGINVFANGGYLVRPYLLWKVDNADSRLRAKTYLGISQSNLNIIKQGLIGVIEADGGTAQLLKKLNLNIAGKTGTAQTKGESHGWFVGFFPHQEPKYAICVFLEHGGSSYEALGVTYLFLKRLKEENLL